MSKKIFRSSRGKYAQKRYLGFILPKAREFRSPEAYLKEFTRLNKEVIEQAMERDLNQVLRSTKTGKIYQSVISKEKFASAENYIRVAFTKEELRLASREVAGYSITSLVRKNINAVFATTSEKQAAHLIDLIRKTNEDFYEIFENLAGEYLRAEGFSYLGASMYQYQSKSGKTIKFEFHQYSPAILEFIGESQKQAEEVAKLLDEQRSKL